jgi:hypothetical protein
MADVNVVAATVSGVVAKLVANGFLSEADMEDITRRAVEKAHEHAAKEFEDSCRKSKPGAMLRAAGMAN